MTITHEEARRCIVESGLKLIENRVTGQLWGVIDDMPNIDRMCICTWYGPEVGARCFCSVIPRFALYPAKDWYMTNLNDWISFKDIRRVIYAKNHQLDSLYRQLRDKYDRDIENALEVL